MKILFKRAITTLWKAIKGFFSWYKSLYKDTNWYKKASVILCSLVVLFIVYLGLVDMNFLWLFGKSPGYFSGIRAPQTSTAS